MPVPFIDLGRLMNRFRDDVLKSWAEVYDARELVGGSRVTGLEQKLSKVLDVPRTVTCANGTDALIIALQAAGVRRGMKVALPNLTFWATFEAVAILGATPVLVDINPDDLQLDFDAFKAAHDAHRFDAALLVHLYGWATHRLADFRALCAERKISLVEDGAQCFGVEVNGKPVLAGAELGTLSFYPAKVVGGAMDGGAMTMRTAEHETYIRSLCNHGRATHYSYAHVGWNSRMGGVNAAFISRFLDELPDVLASRRHGADWYRKRLEGTKGIKVYGAPAGIVENGYLNVITLEGRSANELQEKLKAKGIGSGRVYPEPLHAQKPAVEAGCIVHGEMTHSTRVCASVLNLPLFYGITDAELEESARAFLECLSSP